MLFMPHAACKLGPFAGVARRLTGEQRILKRTVEAGRMLLAASFGIRFQPCRMLEVALKLQ
jgi:hypothetical protein